MRGEREGEDKERRLKILPAGKKKGGRDLDLIFFSAAAEYTDPGGRPHSGMYNDR